VGRHGGTLPRKLFLSYAHADGDAVEKIRRALSSGLVRVPVPLIEIWKDDLHLIPGERWDEALMEAIESADLVLACLSSRSLASGYCRKEWRHAVGHGVLVVPCLLGDCDLEAAGLAAFQLAGGRVPFDRMPGDAWLERLVSGIRAAVTGRPDPDGADDPPPPAGRPAEPLPAWLGAFVERWVPARFAARRAAPPRVARATFSGSTLEWEVDRHTVRHRTSRRALERALRARGLPSVGEVPAWLAGEAADASLEALLAMGEVLFDWILPEPVRDGVLRAAAGGGHPHPASAFVRLVIGSLDPDVDRLPWRLLAHEGRFLQADGGWTIELEPPGVGRRGRVELGVAEPVLVIAPVSIHPGALWFLASLQKRLSAAWRTPADRFLRVARTHTEALDPMAIRPSVVVVHAPLRSVRGRLGITVEHGHGTALLRLDDLVEIAPSAKLLVLDGPSSRPVEIGRELVDAFPGVVARGASGTDWQASNAILDLVEAVVRDGSDHLAATAHHPVPAPSALARATLRLYTAFDSWHTQRRAHAEVRANALKRVDRKAQGAQAWQQIRLLADNPLHRVLNLVGFGGAPDRVDLLGNQLDDQIRAETSGNADIMVVRYEVDHDFESPDFELSLVETLRRDSIAAALADEARRHLRQRRRPVFLLDWGHLDVASGANALEAWAGFAHTHLDPACPPDARIVSFVAVSGPEDRDGDLQDRVIDAEPPSGASERVQAGFLPRLGRVSRQDLEIFLAQPESTCPRTEVRTVARALHRATDGGEFTRVVEALTEAERNGWRTLVAQSHREPRRAP